MAGIKRALISVSDKTGIVEMAKGLAALGAEIFRPEARRKRFGMPVYGDRCRGLHWLTGNSRRPRQDTAPQDSWRLARTPFSACACRADEAAGIGPIDVVVVNLYPFEATIAKPHCPFEEAIENIDIGGPSMLRSAAKNHEDVLVVVDPADYQRVLDAAKAGTVSRELRRELAMKVFQHTARYDSLIAGYLEKQVEGTRSSSPKYFLAVRTGRDASLWREPASARGLLSRAAFDRAIGVPREDPSRQGDVV